MGIDPFSLGIFILSSTFQITMQAKANRKAEAEAEKRRGFFLPIRGEAVGLPVVYGKQIIGGIEVNRQTFSTMSTAPNNGNQYFQNALDLRSGAHDAGKNSYLVFNSALCNTEGNRIEEVTNILVDNSEWGYNKKGFRHEFRVHHDGGTADALCSANGYPATNKFSNCAYTTNSFQLDRKEQQYSGIPKLQFLVKGNHVRGFLHTGGGNYSLTPYRYSNNRVEVLYDYLTAPYGANISEDSIDINSFGYASGIAAAVAMSNQEFGGLINGIGPLREYANLAGFPSPQSLEDQEYFGIAPGKTVYKDLSTGTLYNFNDSTKQYDVTTVPLKDVYRFEGNLTLDSEDKIRDNIVKIIDGIPFADLVWTNEGKYRLIMEYPVDQNALDALINPDNTFTDDDILRSSPIEEGFGRASERFNRVTVEFLNEFENFASDSISWPRRGSNVHQTYLSEDNDKVSELSLQSTATTPYHAMAEAEQAVRSSRDAGSLELILGRKALKLEPGDLFRIDSDLPNAPNGIWKAGEVEVRTDFSVSVRSERITENMFAWNVEDNIPYRSRPEFDFQIEAPTNVLAEVEAEFLSNGDMNSLVDLSWDTNYENASFLIEYKKSSASVWSTATSNSSSIRLTSLDPGKDYTVRISTVLSSGGQSTPTTELFFTSAQDVSIPKNPINLVATSEATVIDLVWDEVTENTDDSTIIDLAGYRVYRGLSANPTTQVSSQTGEKFTDSNREPNTTYNYRVRAFDTQGNLSSYSSNIATVTGAPATSGVTSSVSYVTEGQVLYNPNDLSYSKDFLDFDVTFRQASAIVAKNRYRLARTGATWASSVTDRSTDIGDEFSQGFITPTVFVSGLLATVTFNYDDGVSEAQVSLPVSIVAQGENGGPGDNGINSATVTLFQSTTTGSSAPAVPTGSFFYNFSTGSLSGGGLNGWSQFAPTINQNEELWVTRATASSINSSDNILASEFSPPNVESIGGLDGLNSTFVTLFNKSSSAVTPSGPSGTLTYSFDTGNLVGNLNGWSLIAPSLDSGEFLHSIQATAASRTLTDTINSTEFSGGSIVGIGGLDGLNVATATLYYVSEGVPPTAPTGSFRFTFSTGSLEEWGGNFNGWTVSPTSIGSGEKLWVTQATATSSSSTDIISATEFSGATVLGQSGLSSSPIFLYKKTSFGSGTPASPSGSFNYVFATTSLTGGTFNGWTSTAPDISQGEKLWMIQATATSNSTSDNVLASEFSYPVVIAYGGENGTDGLNTALVTLYQKDSQSITAPSAVTGDFVYTFATGVLTGGNLNGWSTSIPSMSEGEYLWTTQAAAAAVGASDTVTAADFSSPVVTSGVGQSGINTAIVFLYHKSTTETAPTTPNGNFLYNFTTGLLGVTTGTLNGWSQTPPSIAQGERIFQTQAVASSTDSVDSISSGEFSTPIVNSIAGEDGVVGDTVITGVVYWQTLQSAPGPSTPQATSYNKDTQQWASLSSGWGSTAPTISATNTALLLWESRFTVSISGTDQTQTIDFNTPTSSTQFPTTIQSDNFVTGTSGWQIARDGDVEFGAADIRGTLTASQIAVDGLTVSSLNNRLAIIENGVDMHNIRPDSLVISGAATNNTYTTGNQAVNAGSFTVGERYIIKSVGSTNFQSIGAASNSVGEEFHATGVGSGDGTAVPGFKNIASVGIEVIYDSNVRIAWNLGQDYPQSEGPLWGYQIKTTDTDSGSFGSYFEAEAEDPTETPVEFQGWLPHSNSYKVWTAYRDIFRRLPRRVGFDYWVGQLEGSLTEDELRAIFLQSSEYTAMTKDFNRRVFLKGLNEAPGGTATLEVKGGSISPIYMESGKEYIIGRNSSGLTNFTSYGAPDEKVGTRFTATGGFPSGFVYSDRVYPLIPADEMMVGLKYCVYEVGNTDFTNYGAIQGDRGEVFECESVGTGTGLLIGVTNYSIALQWMGENVGSNTIKTVGALSVEGFSR